jgi:predicted alpha-1,6-mannanase (GH76 family)
MPKSKDGLTKWFKEEWVDIKTGKPCGRKKAKGSKRPYPACRPKAVASKMTKAEKEAAKRKKKGPKAISWKDSRVKKSNGGFIAKGCGKVMNNRRKVTTIS